MNNPAVARIGFGQVRHTRLRPRRHAFAYDTFFLMLPMHRLNEPQAVGSLAVNRRAAISFFDRDHGDGRGNGRVTAHGGQRRRRALRQRAPLHLHRRQQPPVASLRRRQHARRRRHLLGQRGPRQPGRRRGAAVAAAVKVGQRPESKGKLIETTTTPLPAITPAAEPEAPAAAAPATRGQLDPIVLSLQIALVSATIATILGALWAAEAWGGYWSWDPKETWALIVWLNYAAWLHMRLMKGLRGVVAAWWAIVGLFVTTFAFLGVNMFLSGLHSYGTL